MKVASALLLLGILTGSLSLPYPAEPSQVWKARLDLLLDTGAPTPGPTDPNGPRY